MFLETVSLALSSIRRNALRSFLTLLGIVIGVAAVIAMITIGSGTTEKVKADISKLGSNLLTIRSGQPPTPGSAPVRARDFEVKHLNALKTGLTGAKAISGASQKTVRVVYGTESLGVSVTGTDSQFFTVRDWAVTSGAHSPNRKRAAARRSASSVKPCASSSLARAIRWAASSASRGSTARSSVCWNPKAHQASDRTRTTSSSCRCKPSSAALLATIRWKPFTCRRKTGFPPPSCRAVSKPSCAKSARSGRIRTMISTSATRPRSPTPCRAPWA